MQEETPEQLKLRKQKEKEMQEESDLMMAADSFGISSSDILTPKVDAGEIDSFDAVSVADFEKFNDLIIKKITSFQVPQQSGREGLE